MKTLKQIILNDIAFQDEPFEPILRIVKEWLTQKPSETGQQITLRIDSMSSSQRKKYAKAANEHFISKDELLEELNQ